MKTQPERYTLHYSTVEPGYKELQYASNLLVVGKLGTALVQGLGIFWLIEPLNPTLQCISMRAMQYLKTKYN